MQTLTLVTGSTHKLAEWRRIVPREIPLENADIDLPEIQSLDPKEIAEDKARRAYAELKRPVVVEDVTARLDELGGLPGPFIKFFEKTLGKGALYRLAGEREAPATIGCTVVYFDGSQLLFGTSEIHGTVVAPRDGEGFGFDFEFVPAGDTRTFSQMGRAEKDAVSHRHLAIHDLFTQLSLVAN